MARDRQSGACLNVFPIPLPPLRERREDLPTLVRHFFGKYAAKLGKRIETVTPETLALLKNYSWPGNIRELDHIIERAAIVTQGPTLAFADWLREPGGASPPPRSRRSTRPSACIS